MFPKEITEIISTTIFERYQHFVQRHDKRKLSAANGSSAGLLSLIAPAARTPGPAREMVRQPFFSKEGDASSAAASLVVAATSASRTSVSPTHPLTATLKIAAYDPTNKHDAVACPDLNSSYRGIAQPTVARATSNHSDVPRLPQLPPPVPARHQVSRLSCSGLP